MPTVVDIEVGHPTTLDRCPPGLFIAPGGYGFKTDYDREGGKSDAYHVTSGEVFTSHGDLIVSPIKILPRKTGNAQEAS